MSSMESLDKLQVELSGNVYADAFHNLYKLSQDVSAEHSELMAQAMKWVHKEKVEPLEVENAKLRELLDYALPIAMYAASTEEGDRMRDLMREVEL